eukprot:TRINITY_DN25558_c0_g1_i1.p1 TRINITY_DN25558_c0_g1~~TRINITY_DN25558_c0_g1_i1.p1  ORF type:complete len:120 (+),score=25.05 TRINITY_DN25558_c0_g1_i1:25-384(+)
MGGAVLKFLSDPENEKAAKKTFHKYDADKSSTLDEKEFSKFAHDFVHLAKDPKHTPEEWLKKRGFATLEDFSNHLFKLADKSGDKKISYEEFTSTIRKYVATGHKDKKKDHHDEHKDLK